MPAPIIYWQPSNVPQEIQSELDRRKKNRGFSFVSNQTANWDSNTGDWNTYRGPMTSWIRMCSNSAGHPLVKKPRFVLHSGKGFYQTYGFNKTTNTNSNHQVIGYTPGELGRDLGVPHIIENSLTSTSPKDGNFPIHVPTPEISRIEVTVQKELFRRATIEWVCFSWKQLEYMTPYFLIPGITVMVEWGWNHFNPTSLVPLYDTLTMKQMWKNSYPLYTGNILGSKGNYDVIYGIVTNFNWSIEGNKIICSTEITSKDRLYAGVVTDNALTVKSDEKKDEPNGIFQSLKDFIGKDDTIRMLKGFSNSAFPLDEVKKAAEHNPTNYAVWVDILSTLLLKGTPEVIGMRTPYVHGVFAGRPKNFYEDFGQPDPKDFDKTVQDKDPNKLWINMGLVVEILNYFSALPGGGGKPMFTVDIQNSVIGGHPNLISCDPRVLIPNYQAPKFHYGARGFSKYGTTNVGKFAFKGETGVSEYASQFVIPIPLSISGSLANQQLARICYQGAMRPEGVPASKNCYRSDLDSIINMLRYTWVSTQEASPGSWSFPADETTKERLPDSYYGLPGNFVEKDNSGLLSNIYISYAALKESIEKGVSQKTTPATFMEIYKDILELLNAATDGFWELTLVEAENVMTITDKKYIGSKEILGPDPMLVFDYYDADSIIKSIKFQPKLTDAQATRAIYGDVNNKASKHSFSDKNDLLNYQFKDAVNFDDKDREQGDQPSDLEKRKTANLQMQGLIESIQYIDKDGDDGSLQMTLQNTDPLFYHPIPQGKKEIIKLVIPNQRILRMLLDDKDEENNSRYCAVQPGITLELTMLGIGGLRTFQYFMVKNLPEPYSHRTIIFRITDVVQSLESGNWETTIRAQPLPLRKYITSRVRGPAPDGWPPDNKS
jgi:hypothetical protein